MRKALAPLALLVCLLGPPAHAASVYYGAATTLSSGTITLVPINGQQVWWFIQNQDTVPLKLNFYQFGGQPVATMVLSEAPSVGGSGQEVDAYQFPFEGYITLTSSKASAQFGSGATDQPYVQVQRNQ